MRFQVPRAGFQVGFRVPRSRLVPGFRPPLNGNLAPNLEPGTVNLESGTRNPEPGTRNQHREPGTTTWNQNLEPEPGTRTWNQNLEPEPRTRNPTWNLEPGTRNRMQYVIGIDLGTTNSAVAYVEHGRPAIRSPRVRVFEVPQLVAPGEVQPRPVLPSFLYLADEHERASGTTGAVPWDAAADPVGVFARESAARWSVPPGRRPRNPGWRTAAWIARRAILPFGHEPTARARCRRSRPRRATSRTSATRGTPRARATMRPSVRGAADRPHRACVVRRRGAGADDCRGHAGGLRRTSRSSKSRSRRSTRGSPRTAGAGRVPEATAITSWCATSAAAPPTSALIRVSLEDEDSHSSAWRSAITCCSAATTSTSRSRLSSRSGSDRGCRCRSGSRSAGSAPLPRSACCRTPRSSTSR